MRKSLAASILMLFLLAGGGLLIAPVAGATDPNLTPIQHLVVIYGENVSFDHYFATYPNATNPAGEPAFTAKPGTPTVNGLTGALLTDNPNLSNPVRLDRSQAITCDNTNDYTAEQKAVDGGLMDKFVQNTGAAAPCNPSVVMDYYDGNTVTALWNYAQNFAMSDNNFATEYGATIEGHLNLAAGTTQGAVLSPAGSTSPDVTVNGTVVANISSTYDDCGSGAVTVSMSGLNVGNLLDTHGVSWGYFQGGFAPSSVSSSGKAACASSHQQFNGTVQSDYSSNQNPFLFYQSTSNPHHLPPTSLATVGQQDQANHLYDLNTFFNATAAGVFPSVVFIKPDKVNSGHAGYSDPLDEQTFLVNTINYIMSLPQWKSTAIIISYDDSDGWYDHQMGPVVSPSNDPAHDAIYGGNSCGTPAKGAPQDTCGYGPRLPLLVISPYAKDNYVSHVLTDQSSILRFIEDNWALGRIGGASMDAKAGSLMDMFNFNAAPRTGTMMLNPSTGEVSTSTLTGTPVLPVTGPSTTTTTTTSTVSTTATVTATVPTVVSVPTTTTMTATTTSTTTQVSTSVSTLTSTATSTATTTQQVSTVSSLAYVGMGVLLVIGLGVGFALSRRRPGT